MERELLRRILSIKQSLLSYQENPDNTEFPSVSLSKQFVENLKVSKEKEEKLEGSLTSWINQTPAEFLGSD